MLTTLNTAFIVCAIVGFAIPLLSVLTGLFGDAFNFSGADADFDVSMDMDFDADLDIDLDMDLDIDADLDLDADAGGVGGGAVPFNMMCFCLLLVVFGVVGKSLIGLMTSTLLAVVLTFAAFCVGALFYWAMYKFLVRRLKSNNPVALSYDKLIGRVGHVTLKVTADSIGMISIKDSTGALISFRAKIDPVLKDLIGDAIPTGETITITGVDINEKFCYVSTLQNKFNKVEIK